MAKNLSRILKDKREKIVADWIKSLKSMKGTKLAKEKSTALKEVWGRCFDAYLDFISSGRLGKIRNFIERISFLREANGLKLTEAGRGFISFKQAVWRHLENAYKDDTAGLMKAIQKVNECVDTALLELSSVFERQAEARMARTKAAVSVKEASEQPVLDALTGLYTYDHFRERLTMEVKRAARYKRPLSLVIFDIDYFKKYNETYGRPNGDILLKKVAELLDNNSRDVDIAARFGPEEFIVALPETEKMDATIMAERVRKIVEEHTFAGEKSQPGGRVTISGGVASFPRDSKDIGSLVGTANKVLKQAKRQGRNRICFIFD